MKNPTRYAVLAAMLTSAFISTTAVAQQAGDIIMRGGWQFNLPKAMEIENENENATDKNFKSYFGFKSSHALALELDQFVTDNWVASGQINFPARQTLARGTNKDNKTEIIDLLSTRQWRPVLQAKYFFGSPETAFRPFIGAGIAFAFHSGTKVFDKFKNESTENIKIKTAIAPIISVGATYQTTPEWSLGLSASYTHFRTTIVNAEESRKFKNNPITTVLSVGYKF